MTKPIIVNLFGGPGAGKSTTRAGVFHQLKLAGVNAEEVTEFAKKLTWEKRHETLKCQPYIFGKQLRDMEVLMEQVEVIVTDSPILLSAYYGRKYTAYPDSFYRFVEEQYKAMGGVNYVLKRTKAYNPKGRNQTESESRLIDIDLIEMLDELGMTYTYLDGDELAATKIAQDVLLMMDR